MFEDKRVLVVDDSRTVIEVLKTILTPHQREVLTACSVSDALAVLEARSDVDFVLCDVWLPDGSAFDVVEQLRRGHTEPKPPIILMTARYSIEERDRALEEGALGYLSKPLSLSRVRRVWLERKGPGPLRQRAARRRVSMHASIMGGDEDGRILELTALNVSRTGAFLASPGPLPKGTRLRIEFEVAGAAVYVSGTVVRVQEPSWLDRPGIGVRFDSVDGSSREVLDRFLEQVSEDDA